MKKLIFTTALLICAQSFGAFGLGDNVVTSEYTTVEYELVSNTATSKHTMAEADLAADTVFTQSNLWNGVTNSVTQEELDEAVAGAEPENYTAVSEAALGAVPLDESSTITNAVVLTEDVIYLVLYPDGRFHSILSESTAPLPSAEFDRDEANYGELFDMIELLIAEADDSPLYVVATPSDGWLRTFDTATATDAQLYRIVATLAYDVSEGNVETYTITPPDTAQDTFDADTDDLNAAFDAIGTKLDDLQDAGVIG